MLRLAPSLPAEAFDIHFATTGHEGTVSRAIREAGFPMEVLGNTRPLVPARTIRLFRRLRPHVAYVFGMRAAFLGGIWASRIVGTRFVASQRSAWDTRTWYRLQRMVVGLSGGIIIANSNAGAERLRRNGSIGDALIRVVHKRNRCP